MRLRNIPRADEFIAHHERAINELDLIDKKGEWNLEFQNEHPIHIEIGMGKGQFLLNMARKNPDVNYIGIERYSSVLLRAVEKYDTEEFCDLTNVRFICMDARELDQVFAKDEIDRIYLNFSDPWPKARHASRRLPSRAFLAHYDKVLAQEGVIEFKTDNRELFEFALEEIEGTKWELVAHTFDLHHNEEMSVDNVMTEYEEKFSSLGNPIHKLIACR